jgi:hypothetical protein
MKKIAILITVLIISAPRLFSQIENITKKSEENAKNKKPSEEPQFGSPGGGGDACADLCFSCAGDIALEMLFQHQTHLMENRKDYPQLFGFEIDALGSGMPSNEIFGFSPNYSASIGIIGLAGSYYRYFQPNETSYSVFTATDIFGVFNVGLFRGNSMQAGYGAFIDKNSGSSYPAFTLAYYAGFGNLNNAIEINYRQAVTEATDASIPYINAHFLFKKVIFEKGVLKMKGIAGMKFQQFYGENLIFLNAGLNLELL